MNRVRVMVAGLVLSLAVSGSAPSAQPGQATQSPAAALSPGAREVSTLIGIGDPVDRYLLMPPAERSFGPSMTREAMLLRLQISEAVMRASLDADGVLAELDSEVSTLQATANVLEDQRDGALKTNTIAAIVAGGIGGVVATAMQLSEKTSRNGNIIGVSGGLVATVLSFIGLRQQNGGAAEFSNAPNMLAPFFDRSGEFHARYPEAVWQYLNEPVPTERDKGTRRERLRADWIAQGGIEAADSPAARDKIAFLTSASSDKRRLSLDLIQDRQAMLQGVRVWIELMKRDLSKVMLAVEGPRVPGS